MHTDDLTVIGAGAAGLAAAIFAARRAPSLRIRCVDGARHIGAKILVSGGSRCNVTNRVVTERDFWGGSSRTIRNVLRAFPAPRAVAFFEELGVPLHEEEDGKLFPDTNRSRTVLDALLREAARRGVEVIATQRVTALERTSAGFRVVTAAGTPIETRSIVLATGGQSLPKTGSDGFGYGLARQFGHRVVPTTPALAPLLLDDARHTELTGVAHSAAATIRIDGADPLRLEGDWLWTHFGASGPLALNLSRHWHRAQIERRGARASLSVCPGDTFESLTEWLIEQARLRPRARVATVLATRVPAAVADAWVHDAAHRPSGEGEPRGAASTLTLAHLGRDERSRLVRALLETPLEIRGSRGYQYAEVTAGGIALDEIDGATLASKLCPGLYFAGEILDVDGRLGGFNFQWAWSSGFVAGTGAAQRLVELDGVHAEV
jgi:predicted Rossmann fold flavoprotein